MLTQAARMAKLNPSVTATISNEVARLKKTGNEVISLSIGVPNFTPPAAAYDVIANFDQTKDAGLKYAPGSGIASLRSAFAAQLERDQLASYSADHICATNGGKHALYLSLLLLADKGEKVLYPAPYWVSYPDIVHLVNAESVIVDCPAAQDYKMTPAQLRKHLPGCKVFLFNNPNNPTGMLYTQDEVAALAEVLVEFPDVWILCDDIYDKLTYDDEPFYHLLHAKPELQNRTFILQSISKNYGLPGWRGGVVAAPTPELATRISNIVEQTCMNVTPLVQEISAACFNGGLDFLEPVKTQFQANRDTTLNALQNIGGVTCPRPQGAFYIFPDITPLIGQKHNNVTIENDIVFCEQLLASQHVAAVPGTPSGCKNAVRLSYANKPALLAEAMRRFETFCNEITR